MPILICVNESCKLEEYACMHAECLARHSHGGRVSMISLNSVARDVVAFQKKELLGGLENQARRIRRRTWEEL
jgi:hypothetical protein